MDRIWALSLPLLAAILFIAHALSAQNAPNLAPDEWTLERVSDSYYRVGFYNADPPASTGYPRYLVMGEMVVDLHLRITRGAETLIVLPPPGWEARPPELVVPEGSIGWVEVIYMQDWVGG